MNNELYLERLREAPDSEDAKFIDYLRNNNVVIAEDNYWILIENCKYHKAKKKHYTAFLKANTNYERIRIELVLPAEFRALIRMYQAHSYGWEFKIKSFSNQSIPRFHVHFIE